MENQSIVNVFFGIILFGSICGQVVIASDYDKRIDNLVEHTILVLENQDKLSAAMLNVSNVQSKLINALAGSGSLPKQRVKITPTGTDSLAIDFGIALKPLK